jgi:hypothetical protein
VSPFVAVLCHELSHVRCALEHIPFICAFCNWATKFFLPAEGEKRHITKIEINLWGRMKLGGKKASLISKMFAPLSANP